MHDALTITLACADAAAVAVIVALPGETAVASKVADFEPALMTTDAGTLATAGDDESSVTVVSAATLALKVAVNEVVDPTIVVLTGGVSESDAAGMLITPSTSERWPLAGVSFVAAVPPSSVSCVSEASSDRVIDVPGCALPERVKTRCATWLPGSPAFDVNGMRLFDSWRASRSEIAPLLDGLNSDTGERFAVIPARLNVTALTADAGE
ncbi:MAG TPA: hypothetical protein VGJ82_17935 [Thermoanaerobaculia bacterium]|jgi:hypothetical protein